MTTTVTTSRLDRPVDLASDHVLGPPEAGITLVEYGSYACPHCAVANDKIAKLRNKLGDRLLYVFRHRPIPGNTIAARAAELAERAADRGKFWETHVELMKRSESLTALDLKTVAQDFGLEPDVDESVTVAENAEARVDADRESAHASGVEITPTFFINGRRYDGVWEDSSFVDALMGSLGHRVRSAALDFARWAPSSGLLLLVATIVALLLTNSTFGPSFLGFWENTFGPAEFRLSLLNWVNDGLLTIFFLVVGLEIKREFTVGHLSSRRSAALPIAAAIGGLAVPVLLYRLVLPSGPWSHGWGVPMSTDTAFAVALIVMLGRRVPVELRIFLTAAAIVDDIGAILVVAAFYSHELHLDYLAGAAGITVLLALLNRGGVYRVAPYVLLGLGLWACVHEGGLHATLSGVVLALFMPTHQSPSLRGLMAQADAILIAEARQSGGVLRQGPSAPAMRALDAIHDRLESPADRMLRVVSVRSNYVVLPLFALANAGVTLNFGAIQGQERLMAAIAFALVVGKPVGMVLASALAVRLGLAEKPVAYSWRQLTGAGVLAGIGFTMSLFIGSLSFADPLMMNQVRLGVLAGSLVSAVVGYTVLMLAAPKREAIGVPA